jgi:tetratricopeptide (TPR) repeat protein
MLQVIEQLLHGAQTARQDHRPADARRLLIEAVELCRKEADRAHLAVALTALGQAERDLHQLDAALHHYEEAAAIYRADGPPLRLAHTIRHLGDIHLQAGHHAHAEPCYLAALDIYRRHPETGALDLANLLRGYAILKAGDGEKEAAKGLWEEAGALYAEVGVEAGVQESERRIAELCPRNDLR